MIKGIWQKVEEQVRKEAEARRNATLKQNQTTDESNLTQRTAEPETGRTAEIMAKKMGISKNTYKDMKTIVS